MFSTTKTKILVLADGVATLMTLNLSGCVTARETYSASGSQGYKLTCNGHLNAWEDCLVSLCHKFNLISQQHGQRGSLLVIA
ncbi:hypothetical protein, partial [Caballeronia calidae]|uniref:hypothetical protein n=1 Tax=Caballeronia calidae TaxID=1777139 RepID=UPI000A861DF0